MSREINHALRTTPFARTLTAARMAAGKKQIDAARVCGVGGGMIANAEGGVSLLGREHLPALSVLYGCPVEVLQRAHDLSVSSFKLKNPVDPTSELRAHVGLALQTTWEQLDDATFAAILALLPAQAPTASPRPTVRKCR